MPRTLPQKRRIAPTSLSHPSSWWMGSHQGRSAGRGGRCRDLFRQVTPGGIGRAGGARCGFLLRDVAAALPRSIKGLGASAGRMSGELSRSCRTSPSRRWLDFRFFVFRAASLVFRAAARKNGADRLSAPIRIHRSRFSGDQTLPLAMASTYSQLIKLSNQVSRYLGRWLR